MHKKLCLLAAAAAGAILVLPAAADAQTGNRRAVPQNRADQNPPTVRQRQRPGPKVPRARARTQAFKAFVLSRVVVENSTLPADELEAAWRPFVGRSLDDKGLVQVTDALAAVYERHDIAIYTVTVAQQDFADGVLKVRALEGFIEGVDIKGPDGRRNRALVDAYLAKLRAEKPLHRSSLERYVSLIRDIPGLESQMDLENGAGDSGVRMKLGLEPHPIQAALSVNNRGTAYLGRTQVQGDLYFNSLFRQGDRTRLTAAVPTDIDLFRSFAVEHSQPIGADGLTLSLNASYLRTRPEVAQILGHSRYASVQFSYPLLRSYNRDAYVTLGVDGVNSDNILFRTTEPDVKFSNDRTRALRAAISYSAQTERRLWFVSGTLSTGLTGLGSQTLYPEFSDLDFKKINARAGGSVALGDSAALRVNASGQYSRDKLPGTEQFSLGGDEYGRGYEASVIAGDYGYGLSAEVAYRPQKLPNPFGGSEAYAFVDGGKIWYRGRDGFDTTTARLASGGVGVRAQVLNRVVVQLEAAKPFDNPLPFLDDRGWRGIFLIKTFW